MSAGARRIAEAFRRARAEGRAAFMPFLTAGDPDEVRSREFVLEAAGRGADIVELGIPFSDPLADGVTIQRASRRALRGGFSLRRALGLAAEVRRAADVPLVFMSYANPVFSLGAEAFAARAGAAGVDGVIVPDLPPEEAGELREAAERHGVATIFLVAPTTPQARLPLICAASRGFVYLVTVRGVTGTREGLPLDLTTSLARVRAATDLPIAAGFGIATPQQVAAVAREADGVIVGSAIVREIEARLGQPDAVARVGDFLANLRAATTRAQALGARAAAG